ncbi:acetyl-CoA C-acyltransferase [Alcaligenes endophyticus]|uniref:acetyl-CoA C-acyltransferase n=1 Tax=Alcaligenes endophyticus TaxID=1929088 RepID=A0ABT8EET0_9BURK|nr:acetyl-CoA C-acyltransferase [Alcaligenes endophyticus]MCX5592275.1 acetyl-CoA C-acyltransferase [Alcaligenes endophyticus]MDN4119717.1 acetyl-CoA C-acyltransferase [Alcaligenes endophyticus]
MTHLQQAYIVAAKRTAMGKAPKGGFSTLRPDELLAKTLQGTLAQVPKLDPGLIEDLIVGCALPEGPQGLNVARVSALLAGLPYTVPGITVNRFCASGLSAIAMAADRIRTGQADIIMAAGVESMSQVPVMGVNTTFSPEIFAHQENYGIAYGMGLTAEEVAREWNVSREDQDVFALASHEKALQAWDEGEFQQEILPIEVTRRSADLGTGQLSQQHFTVERDEGPRADTSLEALAKLRPVFAARGSVTAGNSSQTSDGAGALLVVSERALKEHGLTPLARFVSFAVKGVPPEVMGIGPKVAVPLALQLAGLKQDQLDWIELNEAFAAQSLAVIRDLNLNPEKVNPLGGAIAMGHPLGATGAMRSATAIHALQRHQLRYAMVTMCIGTGMGAAGIFERA